MGLDTSHDCWHGAYGAFYRWRSELGRAAGFRMATDADRPSREYPDLQWDRFPEENYSGEWAVTPEDPLIVLLVHSDCDGVIHPEQAAPLAARLRQLAPLMSESGEGHILNYRQVTERFAAGLELAAAHGEDVDFH